MLSSYLCCQRLLPPSSFFDLDSTFSGFLPFKFYPFMCEAQPFYFDEVNFKLKHRIKELYRFRAYAIDFSIERNQGFPSILFHLGLKQSLKTTNFFIFPKNYSFRKVSFSKEYAYLFSSFPSMISEKQFRKDWFSLDLQYHNFHFFLWESIFRKDQRRFWRARLKGLWNRHLQVESLFSISILHSNSSFSLDADLSYDGSDSSSYHFSFLSNSLDRRSLGLSPVRLFDFKHKRLLSRNLYSFSLKLNFRRQFSFPFFSLSSKLQGYINLCLQGAFYLLLYYNILFLKPFNPSLYTPRHDFEKPQGLSVSSSLNFHSRSKYYFLPKAFLSSLRLANYSRENSFVTLHKNLISLYKPWLAPKELRISSQRTFPWKAKNKKLDLALQRSLFLLRRQAYREEKDKPWLIRKLWQNRFFKIRLVYRLRRKLLLFLLRLVDGPGANSISSWRKHFLFLQRLKFSWKLFSRKPNFFHFRWKIFFKNQKKKHFWKSRKIKRHSLFFKWEKTLEKYNSYNRSPWLLEAKFFLRKLFLCFLALHKGSFLSPLNNPFPSFLRFMRKQLRLQLAWSPQLLKKRSRLWRKLKALELYRNKLLSSWATRWNYLIRRLRLFHKLKTRAIHSPKWSRHYGLLVKQMLRLRRKSWKLLSRLSLLAYALRYSHFYRHRLPSSKRGVASLRRSLKKNIAPMRLLLWQEKLKRVRLLLRRKSYQRKTLAKVRFFVRRGYRRYWGKIKRRFWPRWGAFIRFAQRKKAQRRRRILFHRDLRLLLLAWKYLREKKKKIF